MKYAGPYDTIAADRVSRATLKAKARRRGVRYPIPPGPPVGGPGVVDRSVLYATYDALPREDTDGLFWVRVDAESEALPPGEETIDDMPVAPARVGVDKPDSDLVDPTLGSEASRV